MSDATKVVTGAAVLSYPHFAEPQAPKDGQGKAKFSCALIFLPGQTKLAEIEAAALVAAEEKWPGKAAQMFKSGALTMRGGKGAVIRTDSASKGYPEGSVFLNVRTERQPGLVYLWADESGKPAKVPQEEIEKTFYPGAIVRASLRAFAYDTAGNKGVSFALNNVQKLSDGPRLDGRIAAQDDFEADLNATPADISDIAAK